MLLSALLLAPMAGATGPVYQVTLHKNPGEMLLKVTFQYDANGKNTSRTVYDWGGYVLRRTAVIEDAGRPVQHNYYEGNGELRNYSAYSYAGAQKTVSIYNEFSRLLFQTSYNTSSPDHSYALSTGGRIAYEYGAGGRITKINVFDRNEKLTHYATVSYEPVGVGRPDKAASSRVGSIRKLAAGSAEFLLRLDRDLRVKADVYDLQGRLAAVLIDKIYERGEHRLVVDVGKSRKLAANNVYILTFTLGKDRETFKMKVLK